LEWASQDVSDRTRTYLKADGYATNQQCEENGFAMAAGDSTVKYLHIVDPLHRSYTQTPREHFRIRCKARIEAVQRTKDAGCIIVEQDL